MDIEKALAGILIIKPETIANVVHLVTERDFKDKRAGKIFELARDSFVEKKPFDLVLAGKALPEHIPYLVEATDIIPVNYVEYATEINNAGRKRRLVAGMRKIATNNFLSADEILQDLNVLHGQEIKTNNKGYSVSDVILRVDKYIAENKKTGKMPGFKTGFQFLEENYVRYMPGHLWVITGFTSTGKSKILIEKVCRLSAKIMVISTEMSEIQIISRFYAHDTGVNEHLILSGRVAGEAGVNIEKARLGMLNKNLKIVDNVYELVDIESLVRQESMQNNLDVVFLDYVQNCNINGVPRGEQGREMATRLQQLAKNTKTCIVCFSQVSNAVGRGDIDQFEAKGAGEWASVADVGVRLKRSKSDQCALLYQMQKGRHYRTMEKELRFSEDFTRIDEF